MGGTPLFDETTGESTDRYEYLKKKFPNLPWAHNSGSSGEMGIKMESYHNSAFGKYTPHVALVPIIVFPFL